MTIIVTMTIDDHNCENDLYHDYDHDNDIDHDDYHTEDHDNNQDYDHNYEFDHDHDYDYYHDDNHDGQGRSSLGLMFLCYATEDVC